MAFVGLIAIVAIIVLGILGWVALTVVKRTGRVSTSQTQKALNVARQALREIDRSTNDDYAKMLAWNAIVKTDDLLTQTQPKELN